MKFNNNDEESMFKDINDDDLVQVNGNEVKVTTPISLQIRGNGDIIIEMHLPTRASKLRQEEFDSGGLCQHEQEIVTKALSKMVGDILDHRIGDGKSKGTMGQVYTSPKITGLTSRTDVQALLKKGIAMVQGKEDKFDA